MNPADRMHLRIRQTASLGIKHRLKMLPRIRLAALMAMPENKFNELVGRVEQSELFKKLFSFCGASRRVISCKRFSGAGFSARFFEFRDDLNRDTGAPDIETLLSARQDILALIRSVGMTEFEEHFLHNDENLSASEIGERLGLASGQVQKINDLINEIAVRDEFYHPSSLMSGARIHYHKIAVIADDGQGGLMARFLSPKFLRGRYTVDLEALGAIRRDGSLSKEELKSLDGLLRDIDLINSRRSTIYQILKALLNKQKSYIISGKPGDLVPYTQRDLARDAGVDASLICRAIRDRSIELPGGTEVPLKDLCPSKKYVIGRLLRGIMDSSDPPMTDRQIQKRLKEQSGFEIARRTVNAYKKLKT